MPQTLEKPAISPLQGESNLDFIERVWNDVPGNTDVEKARYCRDVWYASGNDADLPRMAASTFPADRYRSITGSCQFKEHTTKQVVADKYSGKPVEVPAVYDGPALASMCERMNNRIRQSGDFAPLCDGHTPDKNMIARGAKDPDTLGYAGPYYLGKLGNVVAIYSDEHHDRTTVNRIDKLLRRSPEVWTEDRMEERFFDPIACLGSQTPRLDLGMTRYGREAHFETIGRDGASVVKYAAPAMAAPASPSGHSSVPSDDIKRHEAGDGGMSLNPDDAAQIVQAISETQAFQMMMQLAPHMDKLLQLVGGGGSDAGASAAAPASPPSPDAGAASSPAAPSPAAATPAPAAPHGHPPAAPGAHPPAAPAADHPPAAKPPEKKAYQADPEDMDMISKYAAGECDDESFTKHFAGRKASYAAGSGDVQPAEAQTVASGDAAAPNPGATPTGVVQPAKYQRNNNDRAEAIRYQREADALRQQNAQLLEERRSAERYSKLSARKAEGYAFDVDEEFEQTSDLNDEQFNRHVDNVVVRYERAPLADQVAPLELPAVQKGRAKQTEDYQKQRSDSIRRRVQQKRQSGKNVTWEEEAALYDEEHAAA